MIKPLYFARVALGGLKQTPYVHLVAILSIATALFMAGMASYAARTMVHLLDTWGNDVEITLYLKDSVDSSAASALLAQIKSQPGNEARLVSADQALASLRKDLGEAGNVLINLPKNPLPASIELRPPVDQRSAKSVAELARSWATRPEVESVDYGREWVERLETLGSLVRSAGGLVLLVVLITAVVVVAATFQLSLYARREEIEIQKLVGATNSFVEIPFLLEGLAQGVIGACLAAGGLWMVRRYFGAHLSGTVALVFNEWALPPLINSSILLQLCGVGAALALAGSFLAVHRFLRV